MSELKTRNSIKIVLLNSKNELLLLSTDDKSITNKDGSYNGKFRQLVGGKIEDGETPIEASKRELFEETGLSENDVTFGDVIWKGELDLNMKGSMTHINQCFIYAKTSRENVTLKNLTDEEKPVIKSLEWLSLEQIKNSNDIIYPVVLPEYLPDIINGNFPEETLIIDLAKQPKKDQ